MKGRRLEKRVKARKGPRYPLDPKKKKKRLPGPCALPGLFLSVSPLFQTQKNTQKDQKKKNHIKVSQFFSLHQKHKVLFLYPIFFSLVLHFGFGV